jgi:hypothetical protein
MFGTLCYQNISSIMPSMNTPPRLIRQDLDLVIVAAGESPRWAVGRLTQLVDGRWRLIVPVAGASVEVRGDRYVGSRTAALALLRAGAAERGSRP